MWLAETTVAGVDVYSTGYRLVGPGQLGIPGGDGWMVSQSSAETTLASSGTSQHRTATAGILRRRLTQSRLIDGVTVSEGHGPAALRAPHRSSEAPDFTPVSPPVWGWPSQDGRGLRPDFDFYVF